MLGQLLHSFNPARRLASRNQATDSQIEKLHTLGLLFPDATFLREPDVTSPTFPSAESTGTPRATAANDCYHNSIDLESPRDVRVLIAQGETHSLQQLLLFDSKPATIPESPRIKHTRNGSKGDLATNHVRTASGPPRQYGKQPLIASIPENTGRESPAFTAGAGAGTTPQRSRLRRSSLSSVPPTSEDLSITRQKEQDEIVKIALDCMFENVPTTYKGISNKIHIVPLESKPYDSTVCNSTFGNQFTVTSLRGSAVRKPSTLSWSYTPSDPPTDSPTVDISGEGKTRIEARRRTVLVTRTFSVNWTEEDAAREPTTQHGTNLDSSVGHPEPGKILPRLRNDSQTTIRPPTKQTARPPTYAITLVLHLPVAGNDITPPPSRGGAFRRKGSGSHTGQVSLGSSFDSEKQGGWSIVDPFGPESSAVSFGSDVDDRVDLIGQHWDVICRTLSSLQHLAEEKILQLLKPLPQMGRAPKLLHMALSRDEDIRKAAEFACSRVVRGIRVPRVWTGQGRWGIWREEARWLEKWAGGRERNIFFFNLITAFLGTHTEWLNIIGPKNYRRRQREHQRLGHPEELSVPSRTIIVAQDIMAARRFIFLLATFLPANHHSRGDASPFRPSTSASFRTYSQSPPSHVPPSRHESLRRTINRRGKRSASRQRASSCKAPQRSSGVGTPDDRTETGTIRAEDAGSHSSRGSDVRSIMNSRRTMAEANISTRKSSPTTSSTVTPGAAMPVAHIGFQRKNSSGQDGAARMTDRDSLASENLMNALQRSTSSSTSMESPTFSRWGSLKSLWSMGTRRESSTDYSDELLNNDEGLGILGLQHSDHLHGKLQQMVDEADLERAKYQDQQPKSGVSSPDMAPTTPEMLSTSPETRLREMSKPIDVPLKMSINEQDGVIDVQFPGFGSPIQSPPMAGDHSGSSYGSFGQSSLASHGPRDTEHPMNVAGMLNTVHPDFELHAVRPYSDLLDDLKAAMKAEPVPPARAILADGQPKEEWIDICTSLVADTTTFSIKRLRLRRLVKFLPAPPPPAAPSITPGFRVPPMKSQYGNPYTEAQLAPTPTQVTLEEKFEEEMITDTDVALVEVIERVLAQSGASSKAQSTSSSRSSSRRGRKGSTAGDDRIDIPEVPRSECKKMVIGALEQIATAVARERHDARKYGGARLRSLDDDTDSTLREGIKKWFDDVEQYNKAIEVAKAEMAKEAAQAQVSSDDASTIRPGKTRTHNQSHTENTKPQHH